MKKKLLLVFLCPAILSFITGTVIAQPVTTQSVSARSVSSSSIKSIGQHES